MGKKPYMNKFGNGNSEPLPERGPGTNINLDTFKTRE